MRWADLYAEAFGSPLAQAMLAASRRGETRGDVDARLRGQLLQRLGGVPDEQRGEVADRVMSHARGMLQEFEASRL